MPSYPSIIYTITDEAPALATRSFLPIINTFLPPFGIAIETKDISLAGRILSAFPDYLKEEQKTENALAVLGKMVNDPNVNIIKLPNISASIPQLEAAINELQDKGYAVPNYPDKPDSKEAVRIKQRYDAIKGSAVNPVLRQGNSDRRAPSAVKNFTKKNPHAMGEWNANSKTHVSSMSEGDFAHNEQSICFYETSKIKIVHIDSAGRTNLLKDYFPIMEGEIVDASLMSKKALLSFLKRQIEDAKKQNVLFSLHMKATMMKVSDPIIFGYAVKVFFSELFEKYQSSFDEIGIDLRNGFGDVLNNTHKLPDSTKIEVEKDIQKILEEKPDLAMVNSSKGISNLHVPSDIIIDASMPAMIRNSGKMWNKNGELQDVKAVIPDSSYADVYSETIDFCKKYGAFNPTTMGTVSNVGLMAQKAEEYGSHDKTFEVQSDGKIQIIDQNNKILIEHKVSKGDIWRACQVKDAPIRDWIKLAVSRARETQTPAVFWLDQNRPHDAEIIKKINRYLPRHNTRGLEVKILAPKEAVRYSLHRIRKGLDTISVTGNVLRDYLTDLFPILEVGTSAKMLSIVPLMNGGGLFETGAGGSAPKHVQQFAEENHLRWNSLGEFMALAASLSHFSKTHQNEYAEVLGRTLELATENLLNNGKEPARKVGEIDNRGSHFYLAKYWAFELANQNSSLKLKIFFEPLYKDLIKNEAQIIKELESVQGSPIDIGGYYLPENYLANAAMRPSETLNRLLMLVSSQLQN